MLGKFDSYRDSALHFLCSSEWGNESFGDVSTYGVYLWRISNSKDEILGCFEQGNIEFDSIIEEWEKDQPELEGTMEMTFKEFRKQLIGHFLVSENEQGFVTVKQFPTQGALISQFKAMEKHWEEFNSEGEDEDEEPRGMSRIEEEHNYKFGSDRF